jgi:broad specificity phosphatase PhoE
MTRLLLVRHAESEWNAMGRWQGHADPPLSDTGRAQAASAAARLDGSVNAVVSSDLRRARETAETIADALGVGPVSVDAGLREIDVGEWTGLTNAEIEERWPGLLDRWRAGALDAIPGGETRAAFAERFVEAIRRVGAANDGPLLVVTHAAAIATLERRLGVHPGASVPQLCARWFETNDGLRVAGDRLSLVEP